MLSHVLKLETPWMHVKEQIDKSFAFLIVKIYPVKMELKKCNVQAMRVSLFISCLIVQLHPQNQHPSPSKYEFHSQRHLPQC